MTSAQSLRQKATPAVIDWIMNIIKVQFLLEPPTHIISVYTV